MISEHIINIQSTPAHRTCQYRVDTVKLIGGVLRQEALRVDTFIAVMQSAWSRRLDITCRDATAAFKFNATMPRRRDPAVLPAY